MEDSITLLRYVNIMSGETAYFPRTFAVCINVKHPFRVSWLILYYSAFTYFSPEVKSITNCIIDLVKQCPKLKKLYLTANRTVFDKDLLAISKYSMDLEQLDILGTRQVTADVAQK